MKNSDWKEVKLGDKNIIELIDGDRGVNYPKQEDFTQSGYCLFLSTANVRKDGFKFENCLFISNEKDKQLRKGKLNRNDIVLTTRGTIGNLGFYNDKIEYDNVRINSGMLIIRINQSEIDACFLYLLLRSHFIQEHINSFTSGTAQPQLPIRDLKNVKIPLPPLPTQQKIADILGAYDELIENNRRRIVLLENMAAGLYKEWFVRMRPHGQILPTNAETGLPEGWEVVRFSDFIKLNRGFDLPDEKMEEGIYPVIASTGIKGFHSSFKVKGPCVTTGRSGSLGTVIYEDRDSWPLNTSLYVKDFKGNSPIFVYYTLKELNLETFNSGAGVPTLNQNHLHNLKLSLPRKELQNEFEQITISLFHQIKTLQEQTGVLRRVRDRLLPRLMSGELGG